MKKPMAGRSSVEKIQVLVGQVVWRRNSGDGWSGGNLYPWVTTIAKGIEPIAMVALFVCFSSLIHECPPSCGDPVAGSVSGGGIEPPTSGL